MISRIALTAVITFLSFGCQSVQKPSDRPPVTSDAAKLISEETVRLSAEIPFSKITILWFTDDRGAELAYGKMLADRVAFYLSSGNSVKVVDDRINGQGRWSSPEEVARAGYSLPVDAVLAGDILPMKEYNDIHARLFDARNGKLIMEIRVRESIEDFRLNNRPKTE